MIVSIVFIDCENFDCAYSCDWNKISLPLIFQVYWKVCNLFLRGSRGPVFLWSWLLWLSFLITGVVAAIWLPKHFPSFLSCWGCSHHAYPRGCRTVSSLYRQGWSAVLCQPKAPWGQLLTSVNEGVACTWGLLITLLPLVAVVITSRKMFSRQQRDSPVPECCLKVCIPSGSCCSGSWEAASGSCRTSSQVEINAGCFK